MRVAVVGGTGGFGLALAKRLAEAGYEVVVGSREAERAAAAAATVGVEGATNADACRAASLVILATKAEAAVATASGLRDAIGTTPVLSVAAELTFGPDGVSPTTEATSVAARIRDVVEGPVVEQSGREQVHRAGHSLVEVDQPEPQVEPDCAPPPAPRTSAIPISPPPMWKGV